MRVEVRLYATLRQRYPETPQGQSLVLEVEDGATLAGLLRQLDIPESLAKLTFVNGTQQGLGHVLKPGDSVGIFPPIAGGRTDGP